MRVYKSPNEKTNIQKKTLINFNKNVAAPKMYKQQTGKISQNNFNKKIGNSENYVIEKYKKDVFSMLVNIKGEQQSFNKQIIFSYSAESQIKDLIAFVHYQINNNMVYLKTNNFHYDYMLTLKEFKVKNMETNQIQLYVKHFQEINNSNYLKNFEIIKCVGSGGFSKVYLVRGFGKLYAMKIINKEYILSNQKSNIINNEKQILCACADHPFITKLECSFQTKNYLIFVMQFCNGGELFNLLRKVRKMKQEQAKFYFLQTLAAIAYLHQKGIVYRDIKPENIIIDYQGHIRLADYGLSKIMQDGNREEKTYSFCGSAEYMAPEMLLKKGHSYQIDFYCLGALLYELVMGLPPYYSRNQNQLFDNIINNQLTFPNHTVISQELKQFLTKLLQKDVQKRYKSLGQIMSDPWLKGVKLVDVAHKKFSPPFKTNMFDYNFDDADFAQQEKEQMENIFQQQSYLSFDTFSFPNFFYQSREIMDMKQIIKNQKQKGIFVKSYNNVGQFSAQNISRISENKISVNKQSRQPSINYMQDSFYRRNDQNCLQVVRRQSNTNGVSPQMKNSIFYQPLKNSLTSVKSAEHIQHIKVLLNSSTQSFNSIKQGSNLRNIYTNKNNFPSSVQRQHNIRQRQQHHSKTLSYVKQRSPYYSVQKTPYLQYRSPHTQSPRLDINSLQIKNSRNYSCDKLNGDIHSSYIQQRNNSINSPNNMSYQAHQNRNMYNYNINQFYAKKYQTVNNPQQNKKGYLDNFKQRLQPSKVKKLYKNSEKLGGIFLSSQSLQRY